MSALVLRCPNCGSVQGAAGTCETCHEADVRTFCPNHTPGRWLDAARCDACGATMSAGPTVAASPPPRRPPPVAGPTPTRRPPPAPPAAPPTRARPRMPEVIEDEDDAPVILGAPWPPRPPRPIDPDVLLRPAVRVALPSFLGCMGRLAMVVIFLLALLLAGFVYVVWY